jgi:hypothetical protein
MVTLNVYLQDGVSSNKEKTMMTMTTMMTMMMMMKMKQEQKQIKSRNLDSAGDQVLFDSFEGKILKFIYSEANTEN